jgi:hypothetical protein
MAQLTTNSTIVMNFCVLHPHHHRGFSFCFDGKKMLQLLAHIQPDSSSNKITSLHIDSDDLSNVHGQVHLLLLLSEKLKDVMNLDPRMDPVQWD